jgi:hypothetical protein
VAFSIRHKVPVYLFSSPWSEEQAFFKKKIDALPSLCDVEIKLLQHSVLFGRFVLEQSAGLFVRLTTEWMSKHSEKRRCSPITP